MVITSTKMDIEILTLNDHVRKYMDNLPKELQFGLSSIQVFRLENIVRYLKYPTPLLKPQYNLLLHITRGEVTLQLGLDRITLVKNSAVLILSNRIFARHYVSKNLTGYCTIIDDLALARLLNKQQTRRLFTIASAIVLQKKTNAAISMLNSLLADEFRQKKYNSDFVYATLQAVLAKLLEETSNTQAISRQEEIAFSFKQSVYTHYLTEHRPAYYARQLHVTENYLNRCVKNAFGKSSKAVLSEVIIQHSKLLLQETTNDISEIAYMLNFSDPSYFSRLFRKMTGQSPSDYREKGMHILS
jgi:AraC family transcriptional regulator, transcriptional activator of pobA